MKLTQFLIILSLGAGSTAFAMDAKAEIDTDGDGVYSYPELEAVFDDMSDDLFVQIDTNADGAVDVEEMAVAQEAGLLPVIDG